MWLVRLIALAFGLFLIGLGAIYLGSIATAHEGHRLTADGKRYTVLHARVAERKPQKVRGLPRPGGARIAHLSPKAQRRSWNLLRYRVWPAQYRAMLKRKAARRERARFSAPKGWAEALNSVRVANCESGGKSTADTYVGNPHVVGDTPWGPFYGKWQFQIGTWRGFTAWAGKWPWPHQAPEWAQDGAAYRLWLNSGRTFSGHWPVCGRGR